MKIRKLGEFGLIDLIKRMVKPSSEVIKGIGDDCAVIKFNKEKYLLLTCDMLLEGIDFIPKKASPFLIGRKAIACSLSDIAACGGIPKYALISLGLPEKTSVEFVKELYRGILFFAKEFKVNLVGGDISKADRLIIDISLLGFVEKENLVLRNGARKGDIIFVSGGLGGSIYGRHLRFIPRIKEARYLVKNYKINSMLDISDGLFADLNHILEQSNKGAVIYEELIPLSPDAHSIKEALFMGEDFELLFTLSPKQAKRLIASRKPGFVPIGEIVEPKKGLILIDKQGKRKKIKPVGFRHF